jgi:DNA replicative helicase MCM subunit Mcm2 (Cdc46/Mcm family)
MEESEFTKNAFGKNVKIRAPTTIIATANPINNSRWRDKDKVDLSEFPVLEPIRDRFDLKFIFKDRNEPEEIDKFAHKLSDVADKIDKGELPDFTPFLIKYIQYAKQFNPILTDEARDMLTDFYKEIRKKNFGSPRVLKTLRKLTKAIARLKLKEIADEEDAKEAMGFYNVMLHDFQKSVIVSQSPREIAYHKSVSILEGVKNIGGITFEELIEKICHENEQLSRYFGYGKVSLQIKHNKKTRNIYDMLLNHSKIKKVGEKPTVLQWLSDPSDPSDHYNNDKKENNNNETQENNNVSTSESRSLRSLRSPKAEEELDKDDKILLKTKSNLKSQSIDMTKEQYDSWTENENSRKSVK